MQHSCSFATTGTGGYYPKWFYCSFLWFYFLIFIKIFFINLVGFFIWHLHLQLRKQLECFDSHMDILGGGDALLGSNACSHATAALKDKWMSAQGSTIDPVWEVDACERGSQMTQLLKIWKCKGRNFLNFVFQFLTNILLLRHRIYIWCCIVTICMVKAL